MEYIGLNIAKIRYMMINKFKDISQLKKNKLNEMEKIEIIREQQINEIKQDAKIKLNAVNDEINNISENLKFQLKHGTLKNRFFKRVNTYEDEKVKIISKKEINEIKKLKEEVENNENKLLNAKTKIFKLTDLEYDEEDKLHDIMILELKLAKLKVPPLQIDKN